MSRDGPAVLALQSLESSCLAKPCRECGRQAGAGAACRLHEKARWGGRRSQEPASLVFPSPPSQASSHRDPLEPPVGSLPSSAHTSSGSAGSFTRPAFILLEPLQAPAAGVPLSAPLELCQEGPRRLLGSRVKGAWLFLRFSLASQLLPLAWTLSRMHIP